MTRVANETGVNGRVSLPLTAPGRCADESRKPCMRLRMEAGSHARRSWQMSLLSSRFMLKRSSNARSLSSTVAAFAVLVLAATRAEAGHAVSALEGQPLHILAASNPSGTAAEGMSLLLNSLDVEKAVGSDSTTGGGAVSSTARPPSAA